MGQAGAGGGINETGAGYGFHAGRKEGGGDAPKRVAVVLGDAAPQAVLLLLAERGERFQAVVAVTRHNRLLHV